MASIPGPTASRAHTVQSGQEQVSVCLPQVPTAPCKLPKASLEQTSFPAAGCSPRCGVWKSLEEAGTQQQAAEQEQQRLPPPSKVSHVSRAERFNHSFPKTFSSERGLHRSARSLIFPLCSLHSFFPSPDRLSSPTPQVSSLGLEHSRNHYRQRPRYQQSPSGQIKARKERESQNKG